MPTIKTKEQYNSADEDSTSFVESESETIDKEIECVEEYKIKHKILDTICSLKLIVTIIGVLLVGSSYLFWKTPFNIEKKISVGLVLLITGTSLIFSIFFGFLLEAISTVYLKRTRGNTSYTFYIGELSVHIAFFTVISTLHFFSLNHGDFYILDTLGIKLSLVYFLRVTLFSIFILGTLKVAVKYVSMRFNYNMYIKLIRKCILLDFFVSLISTVREDEDSERVSKITVEGDRESILKDFLGVTPSNIFILQKRFRVADTASLSFGEKRLLIKEFLLLSEQTKTYSGNLPVVLGKIKEKANNKADKLVRKLRRYDKVKKIGDIGRYFADESTFRFLLSQLQLQPEEQIEKNRIAFIIEKTYKDRYVISKNLEQINAAIQRVSFTAKLVIYTIAFLFMFIASSMQMDYLSDTTSAKKSGFSSSILSGILSTIFGTQFISKILSDNVIQSVIFLFVIHPFDIGDRITVRLNGTVENLVVAELNIFSTTFYKFDGTSLFVPNSVLTNTPISNIRRSGNIMETHQIQVSNTTKTEKLSKLREMLIYFCKQHPEAYTDYVLVNYDAIENSNKLCIKVLMQYNGNYQQYERYLQRRSDFISEMNRQLSLLNVNYKLPTQKVKLIEKL
ncbi:hypothetical protein GINT2_000776 [Glugoides intestinalis]